MSLPAFSMQSPTALKKYQDDGAARTRAPRSTPPPTRSAPARSSSSKWERGKQITLEANADYWGEKPAIDQAIIVAIDDPKARARRSQDGEIDGFDLVGPGRHRAAGGRRASRSRTATRSTSSTSA